MKIQSDSEIKTMDDRHALVSVHHFEVRDHFLSHDS